MPRTPDHRDGPRYEEKIIFEEQAEAPTTPGEAAFHDGAFVLVDDIGAFDPRSGGGGITAEQHRVLRQLIHFIDNGPAEGFASGAYRETLPSGSAFPTSVIWWESVSKLKKIVDKLLTWSGAFPSTIEWNVYATDGSTKLATVSDAITYSGAFETSRVRTITVY